MYGLNREFNRGCHCHRGGYEGGCRRCGNHHEHHECGRRNNCSGILLALLLAGSCGGGLWPRRH